MKKSKKDLEAIVLEEKGGKDAPLRKAEKAQLEAAVLHEGEPPEGGIPSGNTSIDHPLGENEILRIHKDHTIRCCIRCDRYFLANKVNYRLKTCPWCNGGGAEPPAIDSGPVLPSNPFTQLEACIEQGSLIERVLASAQYSKAFNLEGSVEVAIVNGKLVDVSKFTEHRPPTAAASDDAVED